MIRWKTRCQRFCPLLNPGKFFVVECHYESRRARIETSAWRPSSMMFLEVFLSTFDECPTLLRQYSLASKTAAGKTSEFIIIFIHLWPLVKRHIRAFRL